MLPLPPFLFPCLWPAHGGELVRVVTASQPLFPERRLHFPPAPHHLPSPEPGGGQVGGGELVLPHTRLSSEGAVALGGHSRPLHHTLLHGHAPGISQRQSHTLIPDEPWI